MVNNGEQETNLSPSLFSAPRLSGKGRMGEGKNLSITLTQWTLPEATSEHRVVEYNDSMHTRQTVNLTKSKYLIVVKH